MAGSPELGTSSQLSQRRLCVDLPSPKVMVQSLIGVLVAETTESQSEQAPVLLLLFFLNNADKPVSDQKEVTIKEGETNLDETVHNFCWI